MATEQKEWACPEEGCDRIFSLERGLVRHLHESHGYPASKTTEYRRAKEAEEAAAASAASSNGVLPGLEHVAGPLKEEVGKLEAELAELEAKRDAVHVRLRPLRTALNALSRPAVKPGPKGPRGLPVNEEKVKLVYDFIASNREELEEGFTTKTLLEKARATGGWRGHESTMRLAIQTLHNRGTLRLIRTTVGGGKVYGPLPLDDQPGGTE
jgi:hypothetical protein